MTAIRDPQRTTSSPRLHLAFELGWSQWKLAFTIGHGQPARLRTLGARDLPTLLKEIARAKRRFGLPDDAAVVSCYEAGRDGFWLHRWLSSQGVANVIVDSASIEVNRRQRRAKSDHLDAAKLVSMLLRYHAGERKVWSVVRVPDVADEDRRQVGAIVGLTPTPYQSGGSSREQGISKAGNRMVRRLLVELGWAWVRWQPDSELSRWCERRFAHHGKRARKVGIVALARKLLIALWRYVEQGEVPAGARLVSWRAKASAKASAKSGARPSGDPKVTAA